MQLRNTMEKYGIITRTLHWLTALMIIGLLCIGLSFGFMANGPSHNLIFIHKSTGVTLLILMIIRAAWRLIDPAPPLPTYLNRWESITAKIVHFLLYLLPIIMPITGIIMSLSAGYTVPFWSFGTIHWSFIPKNPILTHLMHECHEYIAIAIIALIALHTAGALKHQIIDKKNIFKRM